MIKTKQLFSLLILLFSALTTFGQIKSNADLSTQSDVIRNETTPKANTTQRVADMYQAIIDSKINVNENQYIVVSGTNSYTGSLTPAITSYFAGLKVYANFTNINTGSSSLNLNSLGSKSITKNGAAVIAGELSGIKILVYNGTNFEVVFGVSTVSVPDGDKGDFTVASGVYTIDATAVTYAKLQNIAALSILGRASNSVGVGADITAASDFQILRRSGTGIGFGPVNLASANAVGSSVLPVLNGGLDLSTLGTANQILGVNNTGNHLEYKTFSISGTAISNDVGWVLSNAGAIELHLPSASSSVRGPLTSSDWNTFNNKANINSPALTGIPTAPTAAFGTSTTQIATTDFVANAVSGGVGGYTPQTRTLTTTFPLNGGGDLSINRTLSIAPAVADGVTLGAPGFNINHFDAAAGIISLDITNIQASTSAAKGMLTSADWTSFNSRISSLTMAYGTSGADPNWSGATTGSTPTVTLNIPAMAASGVNTGLLNNTQQTIPGAKTVSSPFTMGSTTVSGLQLTNTSNIGTLKLYSYNGSISGNADIGYANNLNYLYSTHRWQMPGITFTASGNTVDANASVLSGSGGLTTLANRFAAGGTGLAITAGGSSVFGAGTANYMVSINNASSPYNPSTGSGTFISALIQPYINGSGGSNSVYGVLVQPVETSLSGISNHYGIVVNSTTAKNGFGLAAPSAILHVAGTTRFDLGSDAQGDLPYRTSTGNLGRLGIGPSGYAIISNGTLPTWQAIATSGSVSKKANNSYTIKRSSASTYNPVASDTTSVIVSLNSVSAQSVVIPTNATIPYKIGAVLNFIADSTGTGSITHATGVTVENEGTLPAGVVISVIKKNVNYWIAQILAGSGGGGGGTWGSITGTLSSQTDLQTALDTKLNKRYGKNIQTGNYTAQVSDIGKIIHMRSISAQTLTLPNGVFTIGDVVQFKQDSTGTTSVAGSFDGGVSSPQALIARDLIIAAEYSATGQWTLNMLPGSASITNTAANNELGKSDGTNIIASGIFTASGVTTFGVNSTHSLVASNGISGNPNGYPLIVKGGDAFTNGNGGILQIGGGVANGTGATGFILHNGANNFGITTVTSSATAGFHYTIKVNAASGAVTITLPTAASAFASNGGRIYIIKRIDSVTANAVLVDPAGSELIDGAANYSLPAQYKYVAAQSDGTGWSVIGNN